MAIATTNVTTITPLTSHDIYTNLVLSDDVYGAAWRGPEDFKFLVGRERGLYDGPGRWAFK